MKPPIILFSVFSSIEKVQDTCGVNQTKDNLKISVVICNVSIYLIFLFQVHVSFSMQNSLSSARTDGGGAAEVAKLPFSAFSAVLQSVGITLSDIDDVVFK